MTVNLYKFSNGYSFRAAPSASSTKTALAVKKLLLRFLIVNRSLTFEGQKYIQFDKQYNLWIIWSSFSSRSLVHEICERREECPPGKVPPGVLYVSTRKQITYEPRLRRFITCRKTGAFEIISACNSLVREASFQRIPKNCQNWQKYRIAKKKMKISFTMFLCL